MDPAGYRQLISLITVFAIICITEVDAQSGLQVPADPTNQLAETTIKSKTEHIRADENFYVTDSIFSFRSQKGYFPSLIHNLGAQITAPFHFTALQWSYTAAAAGITTGLIYADEDIDSWARVQKDKHLWVKRSSPVISEFGSNWGVFSVAAAGLISAASKDKKGVETSLLATQAMITSGVWTQVIKLLTGRERPKASYIFSHVEGGRWHGIFSKYLEVSPDDRSRFSYDAFPSGHTATAFSIATVYATMYKDKKAIPVLMYSAASLVGISRLTEHEHWGSDVFVGALLGYLSGKQVVNNFNRTHGNPVQNENKTQMALYADGSSVGLFITF
jgi:hypothetical protein